MISGRKVIPESYHGGAKNTFWLSNIGLSNAEESTTDQLVPRFLSYISLSTQTITEISEIKHRKARDIS